MQHCEKIGEIHTKHRHHRTLETKDTGGVDRPQDVRTLKYQPVPGMPGGLRLLVYRKVDPNISFRA